MCTRAIESFFRYHIYVVNTVMRHVSTYLKQNENHSIIKSCKSLVGTCRTWVRVDLNSCVQVQLKQKQTGIIIIITSRNLRKNARNYDAVCSSNKKPVLDFLYAFLYLYASSSTELLYFYKQQIYMQYEYTYGQQAAVYYLCVWVWCVRRKISERQEFW